jgi:hypothetical protein
MKYIKINDESDMSQLKDSINSNKVIFMLIYMEGCGPCDLVRPEWKKLENVLRKHNTNPKYKNAVIMDINKDVLEKARTNIKSPSGFPTITFVSKNGSIQENFEDSNIPNKNKEIDAFELWIKTKLHKNAPIKRSIGKTKRSKLQKWISTRKRKRKHKRSNRFSSARYYQ